MFHGAVERVEHHVAHEAVVDDLALASAVKLASGAGGRLIFWKKLYGRGIYFVESGRMRLDMLCKMITEIRSNR